MIYIDLDDVCADLTGYANRVFGANTQVGEGISKEHWVELFTYHQRMFRDLDVNEPFRAVFHKIVNTVPTNKIAFLTALPYNEVWQYAAMDKIDWVREVFGYKYPVFFGPYAHDKQHHCRDSDVLIDDNSMNCQQWREKGGISRVYRNETIHDWWDEKEDLIRSLNYNN